MNVTVRPDAAVSQFISEGTRTHGELLFRLQPVRNKSVKSPEFHNDVFLLLRPCDCVQMQTVALVAATSCCARFCFLYLRLHLRLTGFKSLAKEFG